MHTQASHKDKFIERGNEGCVQGIIYVCVKYVYPWFPRFSSRDKKYNNKNENKYRVPGIYIRNRVGTEGKGKS